MRVRLLDEAEQDLIDGFRFYEVREAGLGQYFLDSLFFDVDSLQLYAGIHQKCLGYYHPIPREHTKRRRVHVELTSGFLFDIP